MSKQETSGEQRRIIREGIELILGLAMEPSLDLWEDAGYQFLNNTEKKRRALKIMEMLQSQGVAIIDKERELPSLPKAYTSEESDWLNPTGIAYLEGQHSMKQAGYVAVKPLMGE